MRDFAGICVNSSILDFYPLLEYRNCRMRRFAAFSPAHTTGLFFIHDTGDDPLRMGSLGAGFSIDNGAETIVEVHDAAEDMPAAAAGGIRFFINGEQLRPEELPVSMSVYRRFAESFPRLGEAFLSVEHRIGPPQGSGLGTSGAGALSFSLALNAALDFPLSAEEAAGIAHLAEVENRTGLGTVIGEFYGGFEIRTEVGAPGYGRIEPIPFEAGLTAVFAVFGPYSTSRALADAHIRERINTLGKRSHAELLSSPTVETFLRLSREFSRGTGLLTKSGLAAMELLEEAGYTGGMLMFGDAVYTLSDPGGAGRAEKLLRSRFPDAVVFTSPINVTGGKVL